MIELYGRVDADLPDGRLAYFHLLRGAVRFHVGGRSFELRAGDAFQAEMESPAWVEPAGSNALSPQLIYVGVQARLNPPSS